jgi:hypothetical protein
MLTELVSAAVALLVAVALILRFGRAPSPARRPAPALVPYRRQWAAVGTVGSKTIAVRLQVVLA